MIFQVERVEVGVEVAPDTPTRGLQEGSAMRDGERDRIPGATFVQYSPNLHCPVEIKVLSQSVPNGASTRAIALSSRARWVLVLS